MAAELNARGLVCTGDTVAALMRVRGVRAEAVKRSAPAAGSRHPRSVADNPLGRAFAPAGPGPARRAGITPIPTAGGRRPAAVAEGLSSRKVVGRPMDAAVTGRPAVGARGVAGRRRAPEGGLPAHPGRGGQYASDRYQRPRGRHGTSRGMSGAARRWDNAPAGGSFASLEKGLVRHEKCASREEAEAGVFECAEALHNRARRHPSPGHPSPGESERARNLNHP